MLKSDGSVAPPRDDAPIIVGICAMDKKVLAKPMQEIVSRLTAHKFEMIRFGNDCILNKPIQEWPVVHCLLSFFSSGFPLAKAEAYVKLRKPYCVNDLSSEHLLRDRRTFYAVLKEAGLPCPPHVIMMRDGAGPSPSFVESEDWVEVDGKRIYKPFVEKPVDAEDHNVYIYYPSKQGGGSKRLFRKVGNESSRFYKDENEVRKEGSYIYEAFIMTQGTDIKVYAVGPDYAHAEARKSPVVDGKVQRDKTGKEIRYPIMLTTQEKIYARNVCAAFRQNVVGFDLLRTHQRSYICDVNGWSFVKKSPKYYDDCASVLHTLMMKAVAPHRLAGVMPHLSLASDRDAVKRLHHSGGEELRCVVAVIRHGDRTPKQKMKMQISHPVFLSLLSTYQKRPTKDIKLKTAVQLQAVLDATRSLLERFERGAVECDSDSADEPLVKLRQMKEVLEKGGRFSGINRKVQIKPKLFKHRVTGVEYEGSAPDLPADELQVTKAQLILKWGGVLTHAGRAHAEMLGSLFRSTMYPGESPGLLRLHSTYRHDLKIYSSDEGRVQMTAAAFAKGLLDLEGNLTPILASLVRAENTSRLLDDSRWAIAKLEAVKKRLRWAFEKPGSLPGPAPSVPTPSDSRTSSPTGLPLGSGTPAFVKVSTGRESPAPNAEQVIESIAPTRAESFLEALEALNYDLHGSLQEVYERLQALVAQIEARVKASELVTASETKVDGTPPASKLCAAAGAGAGAGAGAEAGDSTAHQPTKPPADVDIGEDAVANNKCCQGETLWLMHQRWKTLLRDFYSVRKDRFDLSKIPDIYDCIKFDAIHNMHLGFEGMPELYHLARHLANAVVPQEYGMTADEKRDIAVSIGQHLFRKISHDLTVVKEFETPRTEPPLPAFAPTPPRTLFQRDDSLASVRSSSLPATPPRPLKAAGAGSAAASRTTRPGSRPGSGAGSSVFSIGPPSPPSQTPSELSFMEGGFDASSSRKPTGPVSYEGGASAGEPEPLVHVSSASSFTGSTPLPDKVREEEHEDDDEDEDESYHEEYVNRLDASASGYSDIKSPDRHVRTRLYFTSESHVHSLFNALQFAEYADGCPPLLTPEAKAFVAKVQELDYLTSVIFRLYENLAVPSGDPNRYRVEVAASPGVSVNPFTGLPHLEETEAPSSGLSASAHEGVSPTLTPASVSSPMAVDARDGHVPGSHLPVHVFPALAPRYLNKRLTLEEFERIFSLAMTPPNSGAPSTPREA